MSSNAIENHGLDALKVRIPVYTKMEKRILAILAPNCSAEKMETLVVSARAHLMARMSRPNNPQESPCRRWDPMMYKCRNAACGTTDQTLFATDNRTGQVCCTKCGVVLRTRQQYVLSHSRRKHYEDNADDSRFSIGYNLRTGVSKLTACGELAGTWQAIRDAMIADFIFYCFIRCVVQKKL